jgi:hypothetical protein
MSKTLGQVAFEAYNESRGGLTHDGKPTPPWESLGDGVRSGWEAAAIAVNERMAHETVDEHIGWALKALREKHPSTRETALVKTKLEEAGLWFIRVREG